MNRWLKRTSTIHLQHTFMVHYEDLTKRGEGETNRTVYSKRGNKSATTQKQKTVQYTTVKIIAHEAISLMNLMENPFN